MAGNTKLLKTLYDSLEDVLTMAPNGQKPIFDPNDTLIQLCTVGVPINPNDYEGAYSLSNPGGDLAKAEKLARMFDKIPTIGNRYDPSLYTIDDEYGKIMHTANSNAKADPKSILIHKKAYDYLHIMKKNPFTDEEELDNSPDYVNYLSLKKRYAVALSKYRRAIYDPDYDPATPAGQKKFQIEAPILEAELESIHSQLISGNAKIIEQALAALEFSGNIPGLEILQAARKNYDRTAKDSVNGNTWHLTYAEPDNWYSDSIADNFTDFKISTKRESKNSSLRASSYSAQAHGFFSTFAKAGAKHESSTQKVHVDSTDIEMSFKLATVMISRPWMNAALLKMGGWYLDKNTAGLDKGSISSGTITDKNKGTMPLVPVAMIVVRDLKMTGSWGTSDLSVIEKHTKAGVGFGFGPFRISGQGSHDSKDYKQSSSFDGRTISVPGSQIIGWASKVTPLCPKE